MRNFLTRRNIIIGIVVILIAGGVVYGKFLRPQKSPYETYKVQKTAVAQEVSVTGRVKAAEDVNLSFEKNGRVSQVLVKVGDKVASGADLIRLEAGDLSADVKRAQAIQRQAQAAVDSEQAKVADLEAGTRAEELQISQTKVDNAKRDLTDAQNNLVVVKAKAASDLAKLYEGVSALLQDARLDADDAVNKQIDDLFVNETTSPRLSYVTSDSQAQINVERGRADMVEVLADFKNTIDNLGASAEARDQALITSLGYLREVRDFLDDLADTLNVSTSLSATTSATYKGYVNTARANVNSQISALTDRQEAISNQRSANAVTINTAEEKVSGATSALKLAEDQLRLDQAGATANELKTARAQLDSARANLAEATANLESAQAQLGKATLRAPFAGTITKVEVKPGEIVSPTAVAVSLISEDLFQIEADVPEADIAKVQLGRAAEVTLDAYGSDVVFAVQVVRVDPAERIIDGVATYRVTFQFTKTDERIKSGMTANIDIQGEQRTDVLAVPSRTILSRDDKRYVEVVKNGQAVEVEVTTGLRGSDGNIEILSGLFEGDEVILFNSANQ